MQYLFTVSNIIFYLYKLLIIKIMKTEVLMQRELLDGYIRQSK